MSDAKAQCVRALTSAPGLKSRGLLATCQWQGSAGPMSASAPSEAPTSAAATGLAVVRRVARLGAGCGSAPRGGKLLRSCSTERSGGGSCCWLPAFCPCGSKHRVLSHLHRVGIVSSSQDPALRGLVHNKWLQAATQKTLNPDKMTPNLAVHIAMVTLQITISMLH